MKQLLDRIAEIMAEKYLPGLMIGGHAVTDLEMHAPRMIPIC